MIWARTIWPSSIWTKPIWGGAPIAQVVAEERPAGGYTHKRYKWHHWKYRLPTEDEIREQREQFGILPKRAQKIVSKAVKTASEVETPVQASTLAAAYTQQTQIAALERRLRLEAEKARIKWREDILVIAQALIIDALRRKADETLLASIIAEWEQEQLEMSMIFQFGIQL